MIAALCNFYRGAVALGLSCNMYVKGFDEFLFCYVQHHSVQCGQLNFVSWSDVHSTTELLNDVS